MSSEGFREVSQSPEEQRMFIEAFARVRLSEIILGLVFVGPVIAAGTAALTVKPDWDDAEKLALSGIEPTAVDDDCRYGEKYLHIDVAAAKAGARKAFLAFSGLSDKQKRDLYPRLSAAGSQDPELLVEEVRRINRHMDWLRLQGVDIKLFPRYQESISLHGRSQNTSGAVGAMGAAMAFISAIQELAPGAIADIHGEPPPLKADGSLASPEETFEWMTLTGKRATVKAILLGNGRALVFSSSKDANIFQSLRTPYTSAREALKVFTALRNNQGQRHQVLHEFAVGEVKTATDPANLHERMGLASRETQTELRTDRFLFMALLTPEILAGGQAGRVMNNRDLTRFSHVFNLHHCWGWDGGRHRNPEHWEYFKACVTMWCGL